MSFIPYIFFDGNCAKAFAFYEKVTGGKITRRMTYGDSPMACGPMDAKTKRMLAHIRLDAGGNAPLMGADVPPGCGLGARHGFRVNFAVPTAAKAKKTFSALMKGGTVTMPMQETFYARAFGMGVDRFGTPWMIICPKPEQKAKKRRSVKLKSAK